MLLVLCNMVVSCLAIDCASRYTKGSGVGFFSISGRSCKTSFVDLSDSAPETDGSTWVPSTWDRVCGRHLQSGRPHPEAARPDFTPKVQLGYPTSSSFERERDIASRRGQAGFF